MNLLNEIVKAKEKLKGVVETTPLLENKNISDEFSARVLLKREDLQMVRSYKIRGAYNKISLLSNDEKSNGIVCASAGNHAQGVAFSCCLLQIKGVIYMPKTTPNQKVKQVKSFGKDYVEIVLIGDTFDDAYLSALKFADEHNKTFVHPFDDIDVIAGQGTVGLEILEMFNSPLDYVFVPVGGGGLSAGLSTVFKELSPETKIIGVEPLGASSMKFAIENRKVVPLETIDKFVDGAAVKQVGKLNYEICKDNLDDIILVPEGKVCTTILRLYNEEAIVVEPAGALAIAALDFYKEKIKGKNVVCIVSGSNNDIERTEEIKERSLLHEGLKHYFMIQFPQRPGALKEFVNEILSADDDITFFQFTKKNNRELAPALVGLELKNKDDISTIMDKMNKYGFQYRYLNEKEDLYTQLIA
ncbi:threonine ammonia-lyase IlvA [Flavobacterium amniphilum]|uniref:threonine ammonia-lyase IlvA n=1 Tax=Flavobacterium amniphilum TaxID=1834035 RepID=UPI00202A501B|nr:threonine ammonia-lyase IlvA [Flavobacterium amniphilum]MCL9804363.1 threonine ammonia-lyase IlvA [Flavobacterium amniphilum]